MKIKQKKVKTPKGLEKFEINVLEKEKIEIPHDKKSLLIIRKQKKTLK